MRLYQRGNVWYIDYSFNGKRVRKRVGTSRQEAEILLRQTELKFLKGDAQPQALVLTKVQAQPQAKVEAKTPEMVFDKLSEEYLNFSRANKAPQSYRRDQVSMKPLLRSFSGKPLSQITAFDLERYKGKRRTQVEPATINRETGSIKHMFNMAVQWGFLKENHLQTVRNIKEPPGRVRYLTIEEIQRLLSFLPEHTKPIVIMALNTGMRKGEILNLKWQDIDMTNRVITIRRTKNNEIKMIPINDALYNTLEQHRKDDSTAESYVFSHQDGRIFYDFKKGFNSALKKAGIKDFRFHDLRHTFASHLVMAGVDIRTVQELMGHKDIKMTMRYSHLSSIHLQEAVKKLDGFRVVPQNGTSMAQTA